jgi:nucleotide-binding universal stress UspA family protein
MLPIKSILHPTDFSKYSRTAFEVACALARDYGAKLLVVHVVVPPVVVFGEGAIMPEPENTRPQLHSQLQQITATQGQIAIEHYLTDGDAAAEIVRMAKEQQCDVIVMGTHGRTGMGRMLLGSVAEQVVRRAPCPVLTIKTPRPAAVTEKTAEPALVGAGI